ncbi:MAG TPA: hypothetical protein VGN26_03805 [Armatimonadota bacterium]
MAWAAAIALLSLLAVTPARPASVKVPDLLEPGQRLAARLSIPNPGPRPETWQVTYSLQSDSDLFSQSAPDPVYGRDQALGARSWTEWQGKVIERGSLTDGKDYTETGTDWTNEGTAEAFQYVDLGRARTVRRVTYLAGDANHAWKADLDASADGRAYRPVAGCQGIVMQSRWGTLALPLDAPVRARYLRLRYHKDGEKVPVFRMPRTLSVYCGTEGLSWELPKVGAQLDAGRLALVAPACGTGTAVLRTAKGLSPGLYLLAVRFQSGEHRELVYQQVKVAPLPMPSPGAGSRFGINAARGSWAPVLKRLGVGWVRFENLKWPFVSPKEGEYHFDGSVKPWQVDVDGIFREYRQAGISVLPFLFMNTGYASGAPADVKEDRRAFYPPKDPRMFGEFAYQAAARYGSRRLTASDLKTSDGRSGLGYVDTYEIWNEPNLTDPGWGPWVGTSAQYLDLLRAGSEAVKRADPTARVTNGGYAGIQVRTVGELAAHRYADGKRPLDFVDILNVHFYSGRVAPEVSTDDFNARQTSDMTVEQEFRRLVAWRDREKPGMPIWLSETGYDSDGPFGTDERTQAARLPRVVMLALANGMDKVFVYRESGSTASMHAASGVLRDDGSYKPSFLTYATLIRALSGVKGGALRLPYPNPNVRLYLWQGPRGPLLSAWTVEGTARITLGQGTAMVTDAFGRRSRQSLSGGLGLSAFPRYLEGFTDPRGSRSLEAAARAFQRVQERGRAWLARQDAYLYKFGSPVEGETLYAGKERPYTTVAAGDTFTPERGYGFSPGPAAPDERPWESGVLDRSACKVSAGQGFRFTVKRGDYRLRVGLSVGSQGKVVVTGGAGSPTSIAASPGGSVAEVRVRTEGGPLTVALDTYGSLRWLTLVPIPPSPSAGR